MQRIIKKYFKMYRTNGKIKRVETAKPKQAEISKNKENPKPVELL